MDIILETQRLYLRKFVQQDSDDMSRLLQDKDVMYAYEHAFIDSEVQEWLTRQLDRYAKDGIGLWAVIRKQDDRMIGQCGLTMQDWQDTRVVEVGYLFEKEFWNQGYATEAATACKDYAFEKLGVSEVFSIIRDNNIPSQKVAQRNGMTLRGSVVKSYYNMHMVHLGFSQKR